jgi:colanic acid biosynthesis glycosyl transferase WcaI
MGLPLEGSWQARAGSLGSTGLRVYIIYRHYWPDATTYAGVLKLIAERWAADGHEVTAFSAQPSYMTRARRPWSETVSGVRVVRMPLLWEWRSLLISRMVNSALFLTGALLYGLIRRRPDLVMTVSTPPAFMGFTALLLSRLRRTRYLYHCQDLHPEGAVLGKKLRKGLIYRVMMWMEKATHRRAAAVVVLSEDMANTVRARGLPGDNIHVLNNFMVGLPQDEASVPETLARPPGDIYRVLFAGNHSVFQGLEHVIEAAKILREQENILFQFVGEGVAKAKLIEQAGELVGRTVFFHPYVSPEVILQVARQSDVGLIPLEPGMYTVAYPSKTMMLLRAGLPLLVAVEPQSELVRFVCEQGVGWTCPPRDPDALASAVLQGYRQRDCVEGMRERCQAVAEECFGIDANLDKWSELIRGMNTGSPGHSWQWQPTTDASHDTANA